MRVTSKNHYNKRSIELNVEIFTIKKAVSFLTMYAQHLNIKI